MKLELTMRWCASSLTFLATAGEYWPEKEDAYAYLFTFRWRCHLLWESTNRADIVAQSCLDSRLQYESLEGLMNFLAFLVPELWQNKQK